MSRPVALVLAAAGTNRDHDVAFALDLAGAESRIVLLPISSSDRRCSTTGRCVVIAGGFSYADALGAGRMFALAARASNRRRAAPVRRRRQAGDRDLQRLPGAHPHRLAAGRPRPQRERALPMPVGRLDAPTSRCIWTTGIATIDCPIAHGEGRYTHPDPDALAAAGQVALRYTGGNPNGSVDCHRRRVRSDRRGAGPDAASREPRHRPPVPRLHQRQRAATSAWPCSSKAFATPRSVDMIAPFIDIDLPLADRRDGKVRVSYAYGDDRRAVRHHRPPVGLRPGDRRRAVQGPGAQPAQRLVVRAHGRRRRQPRHRPPRPQRARRPRRATAAGRGRRARLHHRRHQHVAVAAVRRRSPHDLRLPVHRRPAEELRICHRPSSRRPPRPSTAVTTNR